MGCKHPRVSEDESQVGLPGTDESVGSNWAGEAQAQVISKRYLGIQRASCRYKSLPRTPSIVSPGLYSVDGNSVDNSKNRTVLGWWLESQCRSRVWQSCKLGIQTEPVKKQYMKDEPKTLKAVSEIITG